MAILATPLFQAILAISATDQTSIYRYYVTGTGPVFSGLFLILGIITLTLIAAQGWACRASRGAPVDLDEAVQECLDEGKFEALPTLCHAHPSLLGDALATGLARLPYGLEIARVAAVSRLEALRRDRQFGLILLRMIVVVSPLFGIIAASVRMSTALIDMERVYLAGGPNAEDLPYVVGHRLTPVLPAAMISLVAAVATLLIQRAHDRVAVHVRSHVESTLMDICQQAGASNDGTAMDLAIGGAMTSRFLRPLHPSSLLLLVVVVAMVVLATLPALLGIESVRTIVGYYLYGTGPLYAALFFVLGAIAVVVIGVQMCEGYPWGSIPTALVEAIQKQASAGNVEALQTACHAQPSLLAKTLMQGLRRRDLGFGAARAAALSALEIRCHSRETALRTLRLIAVASCLLGVIATSHAVSGRLIQLNLQLSPKGPFPDRLPYLVGCALAPLVPASLIAIGTVVAGRVLQRVHETARLRVRIHVENALMDVCRPAAGTHAWLRSVRPDVDIMDPKRR